MQAQGSVAAAGDARLLGALAQAAFIVDPERRIVLANAAAAELLGVAESDLPGTLLLPRLFAEPEQQQGPPQVGDAEQLGPPARWPARIRRSSTMNAACASAPSSPGIAGSFSATEPWACIGGPFRPGSR